MFKDYSKMIILLVKVRRQTLTAEEEERVRSWREECPENEALYAKVMSEDFIKTKTAQWASVDCERAYAEVKRRCRKRARVRKLGYLSSVAASVLLLLGGWYFLEHKEPSDFERLSTASEIVAAGSKAELILANGERVVLGKGQLDSVWTDKGMEVYSTEARISYTEEESNRQAADTAELRYNILCVPRGGEFSVILGDGTSVYLNSESELRYPVQFAGGKRRVFLRGEGYFEVAKDPEHPFVVEVGNANIEVLGTVFNVNGYAEEERVVTTLVEGKVRLSSENGYVLLEPDEQGVLDKEGHLSKAEVDVFPFVAWQKGQFVFQQQSLERVMQVVARWYDVEVVFKDEKTKKISFTGNMQRYGDFKQVVRMLEMTGGLSFEIKDRTIYIAEK